MRSSLILILMGAAQLCMGVPHQQRQLDVDVLDSTKVNCKVSAIVTYPGEDDIMPTVECTKSCTLKTEDKSQLFFMGYVYRHFERLENDYGLMVEIQYSRGGDTSCSLVPTANDEKLLSEINSPCEPKVPTTSAPTTLAPTTLAPTTLAPTTIPTTVPITHDPIPTTVPTTLPPTTTQTTTLPTTTIPTTVPITHDPIPTTTTTPTTTTAAPTTTTAAPTTTTAAPTTTTAAPTTTTTPTTTIQLTTTTTATTTTTSSTTTKPTTTTTPPTTTSWVCGSDWVLVGTACFHISSDQGDWHQGQDYCTGLGAQLASVKTQEEQEVLAGLAGDNAWIGLHDMQSEGEHSWEDQSALSYSNWEPGQPDNSGQFMWWGGEDCVEMSMGYSFRWNDQDCNNENIYICRKDASLQG